MSKFKFKLETVLNVRVRVEDLRKRELQVAEVRREQAKKLLIRCQEEVVDTLNTYRESCQKKLDLSLVNQYHKFLIYQNKRVAVADQHLQERDQEVVQTRQKLVEASKEKKIVEKLKEKAYEAYKVEELNQEIQFLDELGTGQYARQNGDERESS